MTDKLLEDAADKYGVAALERLKAWQQLLTAAADESEWQQLHLANQFFNRQVVYQSDLEHWHKTDYWATPIEALGTGYGDCEDYAIGKYFSLRAMGMADEKLKLMYVRALSINEPHMVLVYFETPDAVPLVLDNMDPEIKSASERRDLKPIYGFNASGLWLAKATGLGRQINNGRGISSWTELLKKIEQGQ